MNTLLSFMIWMLALPQTTHHTSPESPTLHDVQIGSRKVSPKRNVKAFTRGVSEFQPNLYEGYYIVAVQFNRPPKADKWDALAPDVIPTQRIDNHTYYVSILKDANRRTLTRNGIQSVIPLAVQHKVTPTLQAAFAERPNAKVQVIVSQALPLASIEQRMEALQLQPSGLLMQDNKRLFLLQLDKSRLDAIADEPWVTAIDLY